MLRPLGGVEDCSIRNNYSYTRALTTLFDEYDSMMTARVSYKLHTPAAVAVVAAAAAAMPGCHDRGRYVDLSKRAEWSHQCGRVRKI